MGAYLLVTLDSNDQDQLDKLVEEAAEMLLEAGALDVLVADTPMFLEKTWAARSSFLEGIEEQFGLLDECDVVVPVSRIPDFVLYIKEIQGDFPFEVKMFGHAGDGNLHIYTCANDMDLMEFKKSVEQFMHLLYAKCTELGGQNFPGNTASASARSSSWRKTWATLPSVSCRVSRKSSTPT